MIYSKIAVPVKLICFIILITGFMLNTLLFYPFISFFPHGARRFINLLVLTYCKPMLFCINVKIDHLKNAKIDSNALIIANHLTYLDILILFSLHPTSFVTSIEMKKSFFLGQIVTLGGCLFVERRSRKNISHEIREITHALNAGLNVGIFPEATSTNGDEVKRFKRPLFQAAIDADAAILPITLNYNKLNGATVTKQNRDNIFWYGDMPFFGHLLNLFAQKRIDVSVTESVMIKPQSDDDITSLSVRVHDLIAENYQLLT